MFKIRQCKSLLIICLSLLLQLVSNYEVLAKNPVEANTKYVFLFIGDGMGPNQVKAAEKFYGSLAFSQFTHQGTIRTSSVSGVTDSAAAATALACGTKTINGYLGLDAQQNKLTSVAYKAKNTGFKIGIVTSVQLDNATPSGFFAHRPSRKQYYEIAQDLAQSNFDYFAGGGLIYPRGKNNDSADVLDSMQANGYKLVTKEDDFRGLLPSDSKVYVRNERLYEDMTLPFTIDKMGGTSLADLTAKGIELLDNKQGFFMMVEGGKIDYAGHTNDLASNVRETKAFSDAVQVAVDFYNKHPKQTLIIVTADHETGGMNWSNEQLSQEAFIDTINGQQLSYQEFGKLVKQYVADGNQGDLQDWRSVFERRFGLYNLTEQENEYLQQASYASVRKEKYGPYEPLMIAVCRVLGQRAGVAWSTYGHSGVDVPVYAQGVHSEIFAGNYENTQIATKIIEVMKLK